MPESDGLFHCRKCNDPTIVFGSVGYLRKHQWAAHRETYANTIMAARGNAYAKKKRGRPPATTESKLTRRHAWRKEKKMRESHGLIKDALAKVRNGDMRISDVIDELSSQRKFLDDMISMLTEMQGR